jgi:hypothetical protein
VVRVRVGGNGSDLLVVSPGCLTSFIAREAADYYLQRFLTESVCETVRLVGQLLVFLEHDVETSSTHLRCWLLLLELPSSSLEFGC